MLCLGPLGQATAYDELTVLAGATLFDGTGSEPVSNSLIVIRNGRIDCVGAHSDCEIPETANRIDVSGQYITPGLIDAHVHFFQTGFFDSRPDALDLNATYPFPEIAAYQRRNFKRYFNAYLCSGITAVYDVGGMSWLVDVQESAATQSFAPHVVVSSPLITPVPGAPFDLPSDRVLVQLDSADAGIRTVQYMDELGVSGIKFWGLSLDEEYLQRVAEIVDEINRRGNRMIVHATELDQAKAALRFGASLLVHGVSDQAVDDEFIELARKHDTIYNPTLIVMNGYMLAYRAAAGIEPFVIDDPNNCVDQRTRELMATAFQFSDHPAFTEPFRRRLEAFDPDIDWDGDINAQNLIEVYQAGIPIAVGTDAGNPGTLHGISINDELEAMQQAGIKPADLIVMATRNGAKAMDHIDHIGTLENGKIADLIILDRDPSEDIAHMRSITHVMRGGVLRAVTEINR